MRLLLVVLLGSVGGFMIGIALSELIGVIGVVFLDKPIGIKYLPIFTALLCGVVGPISQIKIVRSK